MDTIFQVYNKSTFYNLNSLPKALSTSIMCNIADTVVNIGICICKPTATG